MNFHFLVASPQATAIAGHHFEEDEEDKKKKKKKN